MESFNSFISEEDKVKKGKQISVGKSTVKINPDSEELKEGDYWHPDPDEDRKMSNRGAKLRAREDGKKPVAKVVSTKKLKPGESYMDYAKRQGSYSSPKKKSSLVGKVLKKVGLSNSYELEGEVLESAVPGKPAERVGALTNIDIPQSERDAAKARLLAKTAAKRKEMEKVKEEFEIEEGKQTFPYKKVAAKIKDKLSRSVYAKTDNSPVPNTTEAERKATTQMSKMAHIYNKTKRADQEKAKANRSSTFYRDTHPASAPKMKKANESLSFSDFMEARRMDKEGVDRGDAGREQRAAKAKASLAAKAKRDTAIDKYEKSSGRTVDRSKSPEYKSHAAAHPGSRQAPKVKGEKETPLQTHNRRVNRQVDRVVKHGHTSKEKREAEAMSKHTSRFD
jgi:hypothetical protein